MFAPSVAQDSSTEIELSKLPPAGEADGVSTCAGATLFLIHR